MLSTSGRSSRSTLMLTTSSFITAATAWSSNDSCAITWHQWPAEYPTLSSTGLSSAAARSNASSPHGYHSTGLSLCCRRYGLVSSASRFMRVVLPRPLLLCGLLTLMPSKIRKEQDGVSGIPRKFREILRLFLFTSTSVRADTPVSPKRTLARSQTEEAERRKPDVVAGRSFVVRTWSVAVAPKGVAASGAGPIGLDPEQQEGFGWTVTRGQVASGPTA